MYSVALFRAAYLSRCLLVLIPFRDSVGIVYMHACMHAVGPVWPKSQMAAQMCCGAWLASYSAYMRAIMQRAAGGRCAQQLED